MIKSTYGQAQSVYTKKYQCSAYISNLHEQGLRGQVLTVQGAVFFFFLFCELNLDLGAFPWER